MRKTFLAILFILEMAIPLSVVAQIRVSKLVLKPHQVYDLGQSDIIVADTLVMMDSSRIVLNPLKKENYIRAQVAVFGNHCTIEGNGINGNNGRNGANGDSPIGPCRDGMPGRSGGRGLDGGSGVNLFLYFDEVTMNGVLIIRIEGGYGGNGGDGGYGGSGSPGTVHCNGGDGGQGGNGAAGGNGGNGGTLTISCTKCSDLRALFSKKVVLQNWGGDYGNGGMGGSGGTAGLGPSKRNGRVGERGVDGPNGKNGDKGGLNFILN